MGKKKKRGDAVDDLMNFFNDDYWGHSNGKRKSTWDKHSGANRNQGSGRPNTKSSVRNRHRRNQG